MAGVADRPAHESVDAARLLTTLERLLEIDVFDVDAALRQAADLLASVLPTDKIDVFVLDPATRTLVSRGVSQTPMGREQVSLGLHLLPLANGGRTVQVFEQGEPFTTGRTDLDAEEVPGIRDALRVRSTVAVPLSVRGARRGVLQAVSAEPDVYGPEHVTFLTAVAHWLGALIDRAELARERARVVAREARRSGAVEVLAAVQHDLRNRIVPLRTRLELLARRPGSVPTAQLAALVPDIDALTALVDRLVDVEELEHGLARSGTEPVEIHDLFRSAASGFASDRVSFEIAGEPAAVTGHRAHLQAAVDNLVSNAVRHSPDGGTIRLESRSEDRESGPVTILEVADQGPGVPAELRSRLFERDVRGAGSTGQGLGLYIVSRIVTAHGGSLSLVRSDERGSVFRIELPRA